LLDSTLFYNEIIVPRVTYSFTIWE